MAKPTTSTHLAAPTARQGSLPGIRGAAGLVRGLLAVLALVLLPASGASAQEEAEGRSWQVALWMKGGYLVSTGRMANNAASDTPELRLLETVSEMNPAMLYGGGIEVRVPARDFTVRFGWETQRALSDEEVTGQIAVCALFEGPICEPRHVPADIRTLSTSVRLVSGNPEKTLRPVISAGVGMRSFAFTLPQCPPLEAGDSHRVCRAIVDLYEDPKPHTVLHAGAGLQAALNRLVVELGINGSTGRYQGGSARTDGNWYHVLRFELSTSARVF